METDKHPHTQYSPVDIRVRVSGGGHVSQVYAIRQAIAKSLVAYYAKNFDAASALELRQLFIAYDRTLLIADPRRMEPKKFGGHGARARSEYRCLERTCCDRLLTRLPSLAPSLFQDKNHTDDLSLSGLSGLCRALQAHKVVTCILINHHNIITLSLCHAVCASWLTFWLFATSAIASLPV